MNKKQIYILIGLLLIHSLNGFQKTLELKSGEINALNLSDVTTDLEYIILEIPKEMEDERVFDLAITQNYIFVLLSRRVEKISKSRILQFNRQGKYLQQIGKIYNIYASLFFNKEKNIIGFNDSKKIIIYDINGRYVKEIDAIEREQIFYNEKYYGVKINFEALGKPIKYYLIQSNDKGENRKVVKTFIDENKSGVGEFMRFSKNKDDLLLWNHIDRSVLQIKDSEVKVKYQLEIDTNLKVKSSTMIKGNWLICPLRNSKTRQNIIKLVNLRTGQTLTTLDEYDDLGIKDNIFEIGQVKIFHSSRVYGDVENSVFFLKDVSKIESIKNDYSSSYKVLLIATLK